jgi:hypothetical protein
MKHALGIEEAAGTAIPMFDSDGGSACLFPIIF